MKNQTKKSTLLLAIVATIAILFSACCKIYDKYELVEKELTISGSIQGVVIEGPWEVSITQDDENNSVFIQYNVPDKKVKAELRPTGVLHLKLYNLTNYRHVKLKANIKAALLETIEGSGATCINSFGQFLTSSEISLSGASTLDGFRCKGDREALSLSGASKMKKCTFEGKRIDAELSGASSANFSNLEVNRCTVKASGASKFSGSGYAGETAFNGSGSSSYHTFELESENLDVDLSGASEGEVSVNHKIKGTLSGASTLRYKNAEDVSSVKLSGGSRIILVK